MDLVDGDQPEPVLGLVERLDDSVVPQRRGVHYDEELVDLVLELDGPLADRCVADVAFLGDLLA